MNEAQNTEYLEHDIEYIEGKGMSPQLVNIFKVCHALIDLSNLEPTSTPNVYYYHTILSEFVWFDGLFYTEINILMMMGLSTNDYSTLNIKSLKQLMDDGQIHIEPSYLNQIQRSATRFQRYREKGDWLSIFELIDKKVGLLIYLKYFDEIPNDQKWDCFIAVYTNAESGFEILKDVYPKIFNYAIHSQKRMERLQSFYLKYTYSFTERNEEVTIFHGESLSHPVYDHYSWTMNKSVAEFFATRNGGEGEIWTSTIPVSHVMDYLDGRNEEEVLYWYED
jgi:hypothetical protein